MVGIEDIRVIVDEGPAAWENNGGIYNEEQSRFRVQNEQENV